MDEKVKFSSKIDKNVIKDLREYAKKNRYNISDILSDAVKEYLERSSIRPVFRNAMDEVLKENEELLSRLAK